MLRFGSIFLVPACAVLFAAGAIPAHAAEDRIDLTLEGEISQKCGLGGASGGFKFDKDLNAGAQRTVSLGIDCNVPYVVSAHSENGALTSGGSELAESTARLPYALSLVIPTTGVAVSLQCGSEELLSGGVCGDASSGTEISVGKTATLVMSLRPRTGKVLAGGSYGDVITVQVIPQS